MIINDFIESDESLRFAQSYDSSMFGLKWCNTYFLYIYVPSLPKFSFKSAVSIYPILSLTLTLPFLRVSNLCPLQLPLFSKAADKSYLLLFFFLLIFPPRQHIISPSLASANYITTLHLG